MLDCEHIRQSFRIEVNRCFFNQLQVDKQQQIIIIIMCIFIYRTYHLSSHGGLQFLLKGNQINNPSLVFLGFQTLISKFSCDINFKD